MFICDISVTSVNTTHINKTTFDSNTIVKFADDTAVVGLITDSNEKVYLKEVEDLTRWCQDNNLLLND